MVSISTRMNLQGSNQAIYNKYICQKEKQQYICQYIKDVHKTRCQALTIVRLTPSPYTTKIAMSRCYTILSTIF